MGIAQMVCGGAIVGVHAGGIAEYTLSRGAFENGRMFRSCIVGGEAGAFISPLFYTRGNVQGYAAGYKKGLKDMKM